MMRFLVVWLAAGMALWAQSSAETPAFEVASVKPVGSAMSGPMGIGFTPGGGVQVTGMTLRSIVVWAYEVQDFQVSGGPGWMSSERYDIVGKPPGTAESAAVTPEQRKLARLRLQALLAERFHLAVRRGTRDASVYTLVVAKNGSKLKESAGEGRGIRQSKAGELLGNGASMEILAMVLARQVGRPVIDKTGLTARYDFKLEFAQEIVGGPEKPLASDTPNASLQQASIFTALQEQLGLRLESQTGPMETIAIERVERPTEN